MGDVDFRRKFVAVQSESFQDEKEEKNINKGPENYEDAPLELPTLKVRKEKIDLTSTVNKVQIVSSVQESGFQCKECNETFKDSGSYLDHLNSRRHLANSGLAYKIEKSTVEQVLARIEYWKNSKKIAPVEYNLKANVEKAIMKDKEDKRLKKEAKKKRKAEEKEARAQEFESSEVANMFGFSQFGVKKS